MSKARGIDGSDRDFSDLITDADFLDDATYAFYARGAALHTPGPWRRAADAMAEFAGWLALIVVIFALSLFSAMAETLGGRRTR